MKTIKTSTSTWEHVSVLGEKELIPLAEYAAERSNACSNIEVTLINGSSVYRDVKLTCIEGLKLNSSTLVVSAEFTAEIGDNVYYLTLEMNLEDVVGCTKVTVVHQSK